MEGMVRSVCSLACLNHGKNLPDSIEEALKSDLVRDTLLEATSSPHALAEFVLGHEGDSIIVREAAIMFSELSFASRMRLFECLKEFTLSGASLYPECKEGIVLPALQERNWRVLEQELHESFDGASIVSNLHSRVLSVAQMNSKFQHKEKANDLLHEAVHLAQQNGDTQCLLQILLSLYNIVYSDDVEMGLKLLVNAIQTSEGSSEEPVAWITLVAFLIHHNPIPKAIFLCLDHILDLITSSNSPDTTYLNLVYLLRSRANMLFGKTLHSHLDSLLVVQRGIHNSTPEEYCLAACNLSPYSDQALTEVRLAHPEFGFLGLCERRTEIDFNSALARSDVDEMDQVSRKLLDLSSSRNDDFEVYFNAKLSRARYSLHIGQYYHTYNQARALYEECCKRREIPSMVRVLSLIVLVFERSGNRLSALSYGIEALNICTEYSLKAYEAEIQIAIGRIQLALQGDDNGPPSTIFYDQLAILEESGDQESLFEAFLGLVQFHLHARRLQTAIQCLEEWSKICTIHMDVIHYIQADVYHQLGMFHERDHHAQQCLAISQLPIKTAIIMWLAPRVHSFFARSSPLKMESDLSEDTSYSFEDRGRKVCFDLDSNVEYTIPARTLNKAQAKLAEKEARQANKRERRREKKKRYRHNKARREREALET